MRREPGRLAARRRLAIIGLTVFLVLDAVLVVWALSAHRGEQQTAVSPEAPSASPSQPPATPSESPSPTVASPAVVVASRLLGAVDGDIAWRATTGDCGVGASPEVTESAGAEWVATDATGPTGATALQRLSPESAGVASMIALDDACAPTVVRTYVGGDNYEEFSAGLEGRWYVDPRDRSTLITPSGDAAAPCDAIFGLAVRSDAEAAVLCGDGAAYATTVGGAAWSPAQVLPGAQAIGTAPDGYLVGAVARPECAGVLLVPIDVSGAAGAPRGCLQMGVPPESLAGQIAIDEGAGVVWVWASDLVARSFDGGSTWQ